MRLRKAMRRACYASAAAVAAVALVGPSLAPAKAQETDPEAGRPTAFVASAESFASQVLVNTVPPQFVSEVLDVKAPWTTSQFEAGSTSTAKASLLNPGLLVTGGLSLICQLGLPCASIPNFPPAYPLMADASNPLQVDATAEINGPTLSLGSLSTTAGDAHAHAGRDKVTADATVHGNLLGSTGVPLVKIGTASSANDLEFGGDGSLTSTATASVSDVSILGLLHIDAIEARSVSRSLPGDGSAPSTNTNDVHLDVTGATLAGIPVTIGDQGLQIGGSANGKDLLSQLGTQLSPLLSGFRGSIRTLGTSDTHDDGGATGSATGLELTLFPNTDKLAGVSPTVTVLLGFAGSHAYAFNAAAAGPAPVDTGGSSTGSTATSGTGSSFIPGTPARPATAIPGQVAAPAASGGNPVTELLDSVLAAAAADRMKLFYLAWTISMIGLAVGSRFRGLRLGPDRPTSGGGHGAAS